VRSYFWRKLDEWIFCFLKDSYYSTKWSSIVITLVKPRGKFSPSITN
jgi:hypothetical protein